MIQVSHSPPSLVLPAACIMLLVGASGCRDPELAGGRPATSETRVAAKLPDASDAFFDQGVIPNLRIELTPAQEARLRENARRYVKCTLVEDGDTRYENVAIKLKGAAGSFRELDDRPAWTLHMTKHAPGRRFHALEKFHLNNSVQDESYLSEWICADLCRDAGVPATRVTHARVWLNDRDLGLYVLKEGFDEGFLRRHFGDASGNLYDGGFLTDVDESLEKDSGHGPNDHSDLWALKDACQIEDPVERHNAIAERLDVDAFLRFMAIENCMCHWDGYTPNKNNYRIYFDPRSHKARFLPHGMDQMFGDAGYPLFDMPPTIVAGAVMGQPEWRRQYREIVTGWLPLFEPARLHRRLDSAMEHLGPAVQAMGAEFAQTHADRLHELKERIAAREPHVREQLQSGEPLPAEFDADGNLTLADWFPMQETDDTIFDEREEAGHRIVSVATGASGDCVGSWRSRVLLAPGQYRFEVRMRTDDVEPRHDEQGNGAGARLSGSRGESSLSGTTDWQMQTYEFEIPDQPREVTFVVELRAMRGRMELELPGRLVAVR